MRELCSASVLSMNSFTVPKEVRELKTQDDIGLRARRGAAGIKRMHVREIHAAALVDDGRVQRLGQLDQDFTPAWLRAQRSATITGRSALTRRRAIFAHRIGLACGRRRDRVFRNAQRAAWLVSLLLQVRVEHDEHRLVRRRHCDAIGAHQRFAEVLKRRRLIVRLQNVAHHHGGSCTECVVGTPGRRGTRPCCCPSSG
jgi:hypothetical protein